MMRFTLCLAAAAATLVTAAPALAQPFTIQADAKGVVVLPLTLTKNADLDFGTVVGSAASGTVDIDANTGARTVTGGVTGVPSFPGNRGLFTGAGTAGQTVQLTLNAPAVLTNQVNLTDTITVNSMVLDSCNCTVDSRVLPAGGSFIVGVGGNFAIAANQSPALYKAQFTLTADYQ